MNTSSSGAAAIPVEVLPLLGDLGRGRRCDPERSTTPTSSSSRTAAPSFRRGRAQQERHLLPSRPARVHEYEPYHDLISNLDLKYSVDSLSWNHGASQTEHEFWRATSSSRWPTARSPLGW